METVIFFGGYLASAEDMRNWETSARLQRPDIAFKPIPWPNGADASDPTQGRETWLTSIARTVELPATIVGHSSGCAFANAIADLVENSKLIALDGFRPSPALQDRAVCWSAESAGKKSRNYDALKNTKFFRVYHASSDCTAMWPLHFSLVNSAANDRRVISIRTGYQDCIANLCWLGVSNAVAA